MMFLTNFRATLVLLTIEKDNFSDEHISSIATNNGTHGSCLKIYVHLGMTPQ